MACLGCVVAIAMALHTVADVPRDQSVSSTAPNVAFAYNQSNINSLTNRMVVQTGIDGDWVKVLGHSDNIEDCANLCIHWKPDLPSRTKFLPFNSNSSVKCRSFTRFGAGDGANASTNGLCYGHVDMTWLPLDDISINGSTDSGVVNWPCEDDMDCSLNGHCELSSGTCKCSAGWDGVRCEGLLLAPVDRKVLGFNPQLNGKNMSSWGGSIQSINGTWHMWAVLLDNHCGISSYLMNSRVVHAVSSSSSPLGPYVQKDSVLPPFTHEPDVVIAPTGELVLITVYGDLAGFHSCQCIDGSTSPTCNRCNNSCHPQTPTLSIASSPYGPWTSSPVWPDVHGENPSIWITKTGEVWGMARGGVIAIYGADWTNRSGWVHGPPPNTTSFLTTKPDAEDPFIYQDEDDNFHALLHSLEGPHMCSAYQDCHVGVHAFSKNGIAWQFGGLAYTNHVEFTDGSSIALNRRERPHLVFAENSRTPVALSNSAEVGGAFGDRSFTLVQGIVSKK